MKNLEITNADQIVELSDAEVIEISGGVPDSSPTNSFFCAFCEPRDTCRAVFWCQ